MPSKDQKVATFLLQQIRKIHIHGIWKAQDPGSESWELVELAIELDPLLKCFCALYEVDDSWIPEEKGEE